MQIPDPADLIKSTKKLKKMKKFSQTYFTPFFIELVKHLRLNFEKVH